MSLFSDAWRGRKEGKGFFFFQGIQNATQETNSDQKNKNGNRLSICIRVLSTRYFGNENDARLSLDFVCSVKQVVTVILGSTMMPRNVLNWFLAQF